MIGPEYFDMPVERRNSNSYKWDTPESAGTIPMWVADMDFITAPPVREAVERVAARGIYGYTTVPSSFYEAVTRWYGRRHGWSPRRDSMLYTSGVVPAVSAIIKALTHEGDEVALLTPAYNCFFSSIRNNRCRVAECPLVYDERNRIYNVDMAALESVLSRDSVTVMILCNPHNPGGRVWTSEEIRAMVDLCVRYNVVMISDEIHNELTYSPYRYTPAASVSEAASRQVVTCLSPSKSFNIAGLQIAVIVSEVEQYRKKIDRAININEVCDVNPFGIEALIAAYTRGEEWLDGLMEYLDGNRRIVTSAFDSLGLPSMSLQSTYLAWIDIRPTGLDSETVTGLIHDEAHVRLNAGTMYGNGGEGWIRLNFACRRTLLVKALDAICVALKPYCHI